MKAFSHWEKYREHFSCYQPNSPKSRLRSIRWIVCLGLLSLGKPIDGYSQRLLELDSAIAAMDTSESSVENLELLILYARNWCRGYSGLSPVESYMKRLHNDLEDHSDSAIRRKAAMISDFARLVHASDKIKERKYVECVRLLHDVRRQAEEKQDTVILFQSDRGFQRLYEVLGDTASQLKVGYRCAELALAHGDSLFGILELADLMRIEESEQKMRAVLHTADDYFSRHPHAAGRAFYAWCRGWVLDEHGFKEEAIEDLTLADSLLEQNDPGYWPVVFWTLGEVYFDLGEYRRAVKELTKASQLAKAKNQLYWATEMHWKIGQAYVALGDDRSAELEFDKSVTLAKRSNNILSEEKAKGFLIDLLYRNGRYAESASIFFDMLILKDSIAQLDASDELLKLDFKLQMFSDSLAYAHRAEAFNQEIRQERQERNIFLVSGLGLLMFGSIVFYQRRSIQKALSRSDELLLNILPEETAKELKVAGSSEARSFAHVTVLFTDFKGFTEISEKLSPVELVKELDECFSAFDAIMEKYGIEKIKTIGDAYMAAAGLPTPSDTHARDMIKASIEIRDFMEEREAKNKNAKLPYFEVRIGIHSGPVVAGIVGVKKFQYDIWGDTVNTASRMEGAGEVRKVNISEATYALVKDNSEFNFSAREKMAVKGKGTMTMYFVTRGAI